MKKYILSILMLSTSLMVIGQDDVNVMFISRDQGEKEIETGEIIRVFGYAETLADHPNVPGPTIYAKEGDSVHIDLWNVSQGPPHTIHLHGLDVNQENDGVPHLSWDVPHMEHGYYHFKAPHAGTYLYHCHVASSLHVQAGMYGMIIIYPTDGSNTTWNDGLVYDKEYPFLFTELDMEWHEDSVLDHEHDTSLMVHNVTLPVFDPEYLLVNGFSGNQLVDNEVNVSMAANEVGYLRLANIGYWGNRVIIPSELNARIVASDGRPLPNEEISDTIFLYPGERYGVLVESEIELVDEIVVDLIDMNTGELKNQQVIPVIIEGFASVVNFNDQVSGVLVSPNPFNNETNLSFVLNKSGDVKIEILDVRGRLIHSFDQKNCRAGRNQFTIAKEIKRSGIYMVHISVNGHLSTTKKIIKNF